MPGIAASGLYVATLLDILDTTQLAINLDAEDMKVAMFKNTIDPSPDFTLDTAYSTAPYTSTYEVSGTGYTAGGATLTGTTTSGSAGSFVFDANDVSWASSTITAARGAAIYAPNVLNRLVLLVNFGGDYSTSSGTFTIQWAASIATIDVTP